MAKKKPTRTRQKKPKKVDLLAGGVLGDLVQLPAFKEVLSQGLVLTPDEQHVVFAALCTMIDDVHSVQDTMTEEQWKLAENLYRRLTKLIDDRAKSCTS